MGETCTSCIAWQTIYELDVSEPNGKKHIINYFVRIQGKGKLRFSIDGKTKDEAKAHSEHLWNGVSGMCPIRGPARKVFRLEIRAENPGDVMRACDAVVRREAHPDDLKYQTTTGRF